MRTLVVIATVLLACVAGQKVVVDNSDITFEELAELESRLASEELLPGDIQIPDEKGFGQDIVAATCTGVIKLTNTIMSMKNANKTKDNEEESDKDKRGLPNPFKAFSWIKNTAKEFSIPREVVLGLARCPLADFCDTLKCPKYIKNVLVLIKNVAFMIRFFKW